ncbi:ABC transporter permease [Hymenobacter negativus]|uniref:ABC transporter permease n=1 Tax=Hymenobacter negativus TaxID=2795026 RepID=A0ABS0QB28_9BACT|nr:ABC transporter permease [Hymenobacter negativus]MBH8559647.1 ABC transporter permease [Hymenobacter negativus]
MGRFIFRRLVRTFLAIWALASAVFLLSRHDLDTALRLALPDAASQTGTSPALLPQSQQAALQALRQRFGLDLPVFYVSYGPVSPAGAPAWRWNGRRNQYHQWLRDLARGNLGTSFRTGQGVAGRLRHALAFTLPLTGTAAVLAVLGALALAQRLATTPWWQRPLRVVLVAVHGLPLFVVALILLLVFANPDVLDWLPAYGFGQSSDLDLDAGQHLADILLHLILPVSALVLTAMPELTLQLTAAIQQELGSAYATTARAKGLSEAAVVRRHALRNALLPTLAQIAEFLPALVAGAVVVEVVFALPGMGRLLAEASAARDYPVLIGGVLLTGAVRLLALLLADLCYFWVDPRIRWQS